MIPSENLTLNANYDYLHQTRETPCGASIDFFELIPNEILFKIFSEVTNKRKSGVDRVNHSGLENLRFVSKSFYNISEETRKIWIKEQAVSLKQFGCTNAHKAIEFAIENQLKAVNLEGFPDITDDHIHQLINHCPKLSRLIIKSNNFVGYNQKSLESIFVNLKELKELQIDSILVKGLDLSQNEMLEEVRLNNCAKLSSLKLPIKASNLQVVACLNCYLLESLILPDKAPLLKYLDCIYCINLTTLSLPNKIPKLKNVWAPGCENLLSIIFPKKAEKLTIIHLPNCKSLSNIQMPENAPSLKEINFFSSGLTLIVFPEITPSLEKVTCSGSINLERVFLPNESSKLIDCNFSDCGDLNEDNICNYEKYRSAIEEGS